MALTNPLITVIDRQAKALAPAFGGISAFPALYLYEGQVFRVQLVDPPTGITPPNNVYTAVDLTGYTLDISLGATPTAAGGNPDTQVAGLVFDAQNKWFVGVLDLSQALLIAELTGKSQVALVLEFRLKQAGSFVFTFQAAVTVFSVLDTGAVVNPPPAGATYPTTQEARAGFLGKGPTNADNKIWLSPDGTKAVLQYLDNNGVMTYLPINPPPAALY